jgi:hypothetical protein
MVWSSFDTAYQEGLEIGCYPSSILIPHRHQVGSNVAWEWARERPDLAQFLASYFVDRNEQ